MIQIKPVLKVPSKQKCIQQDHEYIDDLFSHYIASSQLNCTTDEVTGFCMKVMLNET